MRYPMIAAALTISALSYPSFAQSPADQTPAAAQPSPSSEAGQAAGQGMMGRTGMMNMMGGMRQQGAGMGGMAMIDHVEGRIAFLRTELKITDAQTVAWNAFADALRANAKSLGEVRASMMGQGGAAPKTLVDRLTLQEKWLAARLEGTRAIKLALTNLVGTLSDDQKKTADELLAPHMGMMAMMGGMQQSPMGPGRMQPGTMMQGR